jgi:hypothetical protein
MKRKIEYIAEDGHAFPTRAACQVYEVDTARRERMKSFFLSKMALNAETMKSVDIGAVIETVIKHATEFAEVLSARATRRELRKVQAPLRRPRYRGKPA